MNHIELTGSPLSHGWVPHRRETWKYEFADLRKEVVMLHFLGTNERGEQEYRDVHCPAGSTVRIVMVSRMGDVGITENLEATTGYGARLKLEDLTNFRQTP